VALPVFAFASPTVSGNFCTILAPLPAPMTQRGGSGQQQSSQMIDLAAYVISGGSATGNITFQELMPDGVTWVTLATPASQPLAATPLNGVLNGPFLGLRIVVGSLAVSTISQMLLKGSIRSL
jgi:hypothetical protein